MPMQCVFLLYIGFIIFLRISQNMVKLLRLDSVPEEYIVKVGKRSFAFKEETETDPSTKMLLSIEMWV